MYFSSKRHLRSETKEKKYSTAHYMVVLCVLHQNQILLTELTQQHQIGNSSSGKDEEKNDTKKNDFRQNDNFLRSYVHLLEWLFVLCIIYLFFTFL